MKYNLYYIYLTETSEHKLKSLYGNGIPAAVMAKSARYRNWWDRAAALAGSAILIEALSKYGYPDNSLYSVKSSPFGKPYIDNKVHFNLSHSGNIVVCCISLEGELGLDIEQIAPVELEDFGSVFNAQEWQVIENTTRKLETFYNLWTRKESICKADGRGMSLDPAMVEVLDGKVDLDGFIWHLKTIDNFPGYSCHLASKSKQPKLDLKEVRLE